MGFTSNWLNINGEGADKDDYGPPPTAIGRFRTQAQQDALDRAHNNPAPVYRCERCRSFWSNVPHDQLLTPHVCN